MVNNPNWKEEYELVTSNSGFQRHIVPVSELKVINDVTDRNVPEFTQEEKSFFNIPNPETERTVLDVLKGIEKALLSINSNLKINK